MADGIELGIDGIGPATLLARGGSAFVYLAEQTDFGREVAVKILFDPLEDDAGYRRFDRECRAVGAVSHHPNIVVVHGRGLTTEGHPYLLMEYRSGGSLADSLAVRGRLTEVETIGIGIKIAGALQVAHDAGVLHRDVKPGNILLSAYNEPALGDFGIARIDGAHKTTKGVFSASVAHAGREVLQGDEPTPRSDVYGLASTMFELATGRSPYADQTDTSMWAMINRVLTGPPPDPRRLGVSDGLANVLSRALSHEPDRRHQTAAALAQDLNGLLSGGGGTANVHTAPVARVPTSGAAPTIEAASGTSSRRRSLRGRMAVGLVVLLAGTAGAAAVAVVSSRQAGIESSAADERAEASLGSVDQGADGTLADPNSDDGAGPNSTVSNDDEPVVGRRVDDAGGDAQEPFTPELDFPRADIGPLRAGDRYALRVDGVPAGAEYRLVIDDAVASDYQAAVPVLFPPPGRHQLQVQVTTAGRVEFSNEIEIYVADGGPALGYRANLSAVRSTPDNWPEALRQFDQMVLDGHDELELSLSERDENGSLPFWNYYVDGFGQDKDAAQAYCDSFGLGPDSCFVAQVT